jgi:hypothetical protein
VWAAIFETEINFMILYYYIYPAYLGSWYCPKGFLFWPLVGTEKVGMWSAGLSGYSVCFHLFIFLFTPKIFREKSHKILTAYPLEQEHFQKYPSTNRTQDLMVDVPAQAVLRVCICTFKNPHASRMQDTRKYTELRQCVKYEPSLMHS